MSNLLALNSIGIGLIVAVCIAYVVIAICVNKAFYNRYEFNLIWGSLVLLGLMLILGVGSVLLVTQVLSTMPIFIQIAVAAIGIFGPIVGILIYNCRALGFGVGLLAVFLEVLFAPVVIVTLLFYRIIIIASSRNDY